MININKFSIGATAAITTSMGLIAGLTNGDNSKTVVLTGLLVVAIADNITDTLGIHIYKESEGASKQDIRSSTIGNFIARLTIVLTFVFIVLLLSSFTAFVVSSIWGLFLLGVLSYLIAEKKGANSTREIVWHLVVAVLVIVVSKLLGNLIIKIATSS